MDKVERIARALCAADGKNPDADMAVVYERVVKHNQGSVPSTIPVTAHLPAWHAYVGAAGTAIAATAPEPDGLD